MFSGSTQLSVWLWNKTEASHAGTLFMFIARTGTAGHVDASPVTDEVNATGKLIGSSSREGYELIVAFCFDMLQGTPSSMW